MRQRPGQQTSRLRNAILLKKKFGLKGRTIGGQVRPAAEIVHDILPGRGQYGLRIPRPPLRTLDPRLQESGEQVAVERSEEHTSELQSLMRISYAVFCLKKKRI